MGVTSKATILAGAILLMIAGIAIVRFLVHEVVRFMEISAILVVIILVLAWLVARKSEQPTANQP
ncbi:MAG TPA: hypothetical protein VGJ92_03235 [Methanocella sp.]|jgi:hypothetical protein